MSKYQEVHASAQEMADKALDGDHGDHETRMRRFAYAQIMATLAQAAATMEVVSALKKGIEVDTGR